jgi:predicted AlkP superfamily pyrophosphatase or phosphodiesterase
MRLPLRSAVLGLLLSLLLSNLSFASAYNARPKLIVIIVIDQFRADYLDRYRSQFAEGGFRLFLDHGANFTECNYDYASTSTAPGHSTLLTGAYSIGHGIMTNAWWDPQKRRSVTSVEDDSTRLVGVSADVPGSSPHNLMASTLGDELRLATQGKARVFGVSLKDRAAVLPAGYSGEAYWIDGESGLFVTSTYYRPQLPRWAQDFNNSKHAGKYLNREWKDANGNVLRTTTAKNGKANFFDLVGPTPFANDYEFDFARELIANEKLGDGPVTDLLTISLSANDILGHEVGPDSPEMKAMALALDRQFADFFSFLGQQIGLANVWLVLSADHGIAPVAAVAAKLHIPAVGLNDNKRRAQLNQSLSAALGRKADYVPEFDYPFAWLDPQAFASLKMKEEDAEHAVGEALKQNGLRGYFTRSQLAKGDVPNSELALKYLHSYSPHGSWYVIGVPAPFSMDTEHGTDHISPYTYDTHVPLAFYGLPFQPGTYRRHTEPIDLAVTLASLLGINAPTHATGRVLTEALAPARRGPTDPDSQTNHTPRPPSHEIKPARFSTQEGAN